MSKQTDDTLKPAAEERNHHAMVKAIIFHETANGTKGVGQTHNNLCGIRRGGAFVRYSNRDDSWNDCMDLYMRVYKNLSIAQMSRKWTSTQQDEWERNVTYFYNQFNNEESKLQKGA